MIIDVQQMSGPPNPIFRDGGPELAGGKLRQWSSGRVVGVNPLVATCQAINYVFVFYSFCPRVASRSQASTASVFAVAQANH